MTSDVKFVLVVGASGQVGNVVSKALIRSNKFKVFALVRTESEGSKKSLYDELKNEGVVLVKSDFDKNSLAAAFAENRIDTIVCTLNSYDGAVMETTEKLLIDAAVASKTVKRFLPSEYGTDVENAPIGGYIDSKRVVEEYVKKSGLQYTFIITGVFYEFISEFGIDYEHHKAIIFNGGNFKIQITHVLDIGKYVLEILLDPSTINKSVLIQSNERITYNDIIKIFEKVSGKQFERSSKDTPELLKEINENNGWPALFAYIRNLFSTYEVPNYEARLYQPKTFVPLTIERYAISFYKKQML